MSIFIGMLLTAIGTFCIIIFGFETSYVSMFLASIVSGIGLGIANPSITTAAIGSVKESRASLAGGIVFMFQLSGAALGLAVITTIFIDTAINDFLGRISPLDLGLSATDLGSIKSFMLGSSSEQILERDVGSSMLTKLIPHIRNSYIAGLKIGLGVSGVLALFGAQLALFFLKK